MSHMRFPLSASIVLLGLLISPLCQADPVRTSHVTAELISEQATAKAGEPSWIGLRLEMEPHWHTYWRFPGDSGLPTKVEWKLPEEWKISAPHWPIPSRIPLPPLVNFGFEGEVLIGYTVEIPAGAKAAEYLLEGKASWLVCKEECIPESAQLKLKVRVGAEAPRKNAWANLFERLRLQSPENLPPEVSASLKVEEKRIGVSLNDPKGIITGEIDFFPLVPQLVKATSSPKVERQGEVKTLWLEKAEPFSTSASAFFGQIVLGPKKQPRVFEFSLPLNAQGISSPREPIREDPGILLAALFAFLGGVLLNLMPCVFPVLGIKVMALVSQGKGDKWHARKHGKIYALGVLVSFWVLTASLLSLRAAGQSVGWGFQLQQPGFVLSLILLFSLLAANLAGFFDFGGRLMGVGGNLANRDGVSGSFFTGILAVIVATPCTAPFMGTAIGVVLAQPAWAVLLVFTSLGLGLAAPFVLLSYQPSLLAALPRPGAWMERLKEFFAFPMAATVLWLLWVLGMQVGLDGMIVAAGGLLLIFLSIWVGRGFRGPYARGIHWALLVAGALLATSSLRWKANIGAADGSSQWKKYSASVVSEALTAKRAVFVDFTAAWCLTCQVNKSLVLDRADMQKFFQEKKVVLLRADWTNHDPEITKALEEYSRIGVPLYLAFPAGSNRAEILPQVLTDARIREAFP